MHREALSALRRRERVYERTQLELNTAEQATMELATRYLERRMVPDLERITGGRYRRVRIDDSNLGMEIYAPERGDWVPVTDLSQGTLDVVYLAARIGLVRLVTGDRRPPILLDDPFVTLDDARAARALELLRDLSTRLPGHLLHDVGPLRRAGRAGHRARRSHRRRPARAGGGGPCLRSRDRSRSWRSASSRRPAGGRATSAADSSAVARRCSASCSGCSSSA